MRVIPTHVYRIFCIVQLRKEVHHKGDPMGDAPLSATSCSVSTLLLSEGRKNCSFCPDQYMGTATHNSPPAHTHTHTHTWTVTSINL